MIQLKPSVKIYIAFICGIAGIISILTKVSVPVGLLLLTISFIIIIHDMDKMEQYKEHLERSQRSKLDKKENEKMIRILIGFAFYFWVSILSKIVVKIDFIFVVIIGALGFLIGLGIGKRLLSLKRNIWSITLLLAIGGGILGLDRLYLRKWGTGMLKAFTLGGLGVWWLIDIILVLSNRMTNSEGRIIKSKQKEL